MHQKVTYLVPDLYRQLMVASSNNFLENEILATIKSTTINFSYVLKTGYKTRPKKCNLYDHLGFARYMYSMSVLTLGYVMTTSICWRKHVRIHIKI